MFRKGWTIFYFLYYYYYYILFNVGGVQQREEGVMATGERGKKV